MDEAEEEEDGQSDQETEPGTLIGNAVLKPSQPRPSLSPLGINIGLATAGAGATDNESAGPGVKRVATAAAFDTGVLTTSPSPLAGTSSDTVSNSANTNETAKNRTPATEEQKARKRESARRLRETRAAATAAAAAAATASPGDAAAAAADGVAPLAVGTQTAPANGTPTRPAKISGLPPRAPAARPKLGAAVLAQRAGTLATSAAITGTPSQPPRGLGISGTRAVGIQLAAPGHEHASGGVRKHHLRASKRVAGTVVETHAARVRHAVVLRRQDKTDLALGVLIAGEVRSKV